MLSAKLAEVINPLTTMLTTCLSNAREHIAKSGEIRQKTTNRIAEAQGNYPSFKQNSAEKENFVISKVTESQPLFGKGRLRPRRFKKMTTRPLSKEIRINKKKSSQKLCFLDNSTQETRLEEF